MSSFLSRFALLVAILLFASAAQAASLSGEYLGIGEAEGARIQISPDDEGYSGTFFDARGARQSFAADRNGDAAEAVLDMDNRAVFLRMSPLPYGAEVAVIPFSAEGVLDIQAGRVLNFVRSNLSIPPPPADFVAAPIDDQGRVTANGFLASYQFWPPTGVRNAYLSLAPRFQTVLRLVATVQLDIIWKLCLAPDNTRALSIALRGQGVSCAEVVDAFAEMQRTGRFDDFKRDVARDNAWLRNSVKCADGYRVAQADCDAAARNMSEKAVSLETAGTLLSRYQ